VILESRLETDPLKGKVRDVGALEGDRIFRAFNGLAHVEDSCRVVTLPRQTVGSLQGTKRREIIVSADFRDLE